MKTVIIDIKSKILYASFYIQGLLQMYGEENVHYGSTLFKDLDKDSPKERFDHYFAFIITENQIKTKIIIDFNDDQYISQIAYDWSDIYGKVNLTNEDKRRYVKIKSLAPGFAINIFNSRANAIIVGLLNYLRCYSFSISPKEFFAGYISRKRLRIHEYNNFYSTPKNNMVFMVGRLWSHENWESEVNMWRACFIDALKELGLFNYFVGGFVTSKTEGLEKYRSYPLIDKIGIAEYLENTQKSLFVFNTPAVHKCHGWKLPEFMLLGKAIISTPIFYELPHKLEHGYHVHFVSTKTELKNGIALLLQDSNYRMRLQNGAKEYYDKFLAPQAAIKNFLH